MFSIHDIDDDVGLQCESCDLDKTVTFAGPNNIKLPNIVNLSHEILDSAGIFLLENGHDLFIWIGRQVTQNYIQALFGVNSLDILNFATLRTMETTDYSYRVSTIVAALRADRSRFMQLHIIKEGDRYSEAFFLRYLVDDRASYMGGDVTYPEYYAYVSQQ